MIGGCTFAGSSCCSTSWDEHSQAGGWPWLVWQSALLVVFMTRSRDLDRASYHMQSGISASYRKNYVPRKYKHILIILFVVLEYLRARFYPVTHWSPTKDTGKLWNNLAQAIITALALAIYPAANTLWPSHSTIMMMADPLVIKIPRLVSITDSNISLVWTYEIISLILRLFTDCSNCV